MNKSWVYPDLEILRLISDKKVGSTQVVQLTGLYRDLVTSTLRELRRGNLIRTAKDPKHKQRKWILLTDLGRELTELLKMSQEYTEKSDKFLRMWPRLLFLTKELPDLFWKDDPEQDKSKMLKINAFKFKMKSVGWDDEDIPYYVESINNIIHLKEIYDKNFFYILYLRFLKCHISFKINHQAQKVITNILSTLIGEKILKIQQLEKNHLVMELGGYYGSLPAVSDAYDFNMKKYPQRGGIINLLYDIMRIFVYPLPFMIKSEIRELVRCYIHLVLPLFNNSLISDIIKGFREELTNQENELENIRNLSKIQFEEYIRLYGSFFDHVFTEKTIYDFLRLRIRSMRFLLDILSSTM